MEKETYTVRLLKPQYYIQYQDVSWVMKLPEHVKKKALNIWRLRWQKLFYAGLEAGKISMRLMDYIVRLEVEMYERCCAIKWPEMVVNSYSGDDVPVGMYSMRWYNHKFSPCQEFLNRLQREAEDRKDPYGTPSIPTGSFIIKGKNAKHITNEFFIINAE